MSIATTTFNGGVAQNMPWYGGNFALTCNNNRRDSSSAFVELQSDVHDGLTLAYTQPLLRGLVHRPDSGSSCRSRRSIVRSPKRRCAPR